MSRDSVLRVKDWERFQHYKHRGPLWIKVYGKLLDNIAFISLPEAAQGQLVKLWLLAARCGNVIPDDRGFLKHSLHTTRLYIDQLVSAGFVERTTRRDAEQNASEFASNGASEFVAECEQNARPEKRERREEKEKRERSAVGGSDSFGGVIEVPASPSPPTAVMRAFVAMVPKARRRAWHATIQSWRNGLGYVGGRRASDDDIAQGLTEYLAAPRDGDPDFSPKHVVRFVEHAEQQRLSVGVPPAVAARTNGHRPSVADQTHDSALRAALRVQAIVNGAPQEEPA